MDGIRFVASGTIAKTSKASTERRKREREELKGQLQHKLDSHERKKHRKAVQDRWVNPVLEMQLEERSAKRSEHKKKKKHKRKRRPGSNSDGETTDTSMIVASASDRSAVGMSWMCKPMSRPSKHSAELSEEEKKRKQEAEEKSALDAQIEREVDDGKREKHSKLPFGLYQPPRTTFNELASASASEPSHPRVPTVGDGGKSWRARAERRAREAARNPELQKVPLMRERRSDSKEKNTAPGSERGVQHHGPRHRSVGLRRKVKSWERNGRIDEEQSASASERFERLMGGGTELQRAGLAQQQPVRQERKSAVKQIAGAGSSTVASEKELNSLVAKALRAEMMGDTARHADLTEQIARVRHALECPDRADGGGRADGNVVVVAPLDERGRLLPGASRSSNTSDEPLAREDVRSGARRGKRSEGNARRTLHGSDGHRRAYFASDIKSSNVSETERRELTLSELVAREKRSKAHGDVVGDIASMDEVHARNILRECKGARYKSHEHQASQSGFDEEDDVDISMFTSKRERMTSRRAQEHDRARALQAERRAHRAQASCPFSFDGPNFKKHLVISLGEHAFLMLPPGSRASLLDECHARIVPFKTASSLRDAGEEVLAEINRFRSCFERFAASRGQSVVYLETVPDPKRTGWHTCLECIPVDAEAAELVPMFFKKALLDADEEWSTNRKVIDTCAKGGLVHAIPPDFPYFHVEWAGGGYPTGGFAHVIENASLFPHNFGTDTLAGVVGADPSRFNRKQNRGSFEAERTRVMDFLKAWAPFDWTQALSGGEILPSTLT